MARDHERLLEAGNRAQLEKLNRDTHKGSFPRSIEEITERLLDEVDELLRAVEPKEIRSEAADIANFAHMLILAVDK